MLPARWLSNKEQASEGRPSRGKVFLFYSSLSCPPSTPSCSFSNPEHKNSFSLDVQNHTGQKDAGFPYTPPGTLLVLLPFQVPTENNWFVVAHVLDEAKSSYSSLTLRMQWVGAYPTSYKKRPLQQDLSLHFIPILSVCWTPHFVRYVSWNHQRVGRWGEMYVRGIEGEIHKFIPHSLTHPPHPNQ